jgi:hypothetical protein
MHRPLILGSVLVAVVGLAVTRVHDLESELARLSSAPTPIPEVPRTVLLQLRDLDDGLTMALAELDAMRGDAEVKAIEVVEGHLAAFRSNYGEYANIERELASLRQAYLLLSTAADNRTDQSTSANEKAEQLRKELEAHLKTALDNLRTEEQRRWEDLTQAVSATSSRMKQVDDEVADLGLRMMSASPQVRWTEMVGPTVRLEGSTTVGSGVVLESRPHPDGRGYQTLLLTAWHVVRDIQANGSDDKIPVPVEIHRQQGSRYEIGRLLAKNPKLDAALLELQTRKPVEHGARLASRSALTSMQVFDEIYAVGCPLGNDPIPTRGEVSDLRHVLDETNYWMISAPTYIGNSGGGIFDGQERRLMALFSKIYTHGTIRPTIIPHMGLASPLDAIYDWLEAEGIANIEESDEDGTARVVLTRTFAADVVAPSGTALTNAESVEHR